MAATTRIRINATAGDCLNEILFEKYPEEAFVPFREAMIDGPCSFAPFSHEFMAERADFHDSSHEEYEKYMADFLGLLDRLYDCSEIVLWFGGEPFCQKNTEVVIATSKQRNFQGSLSFSIVIEETGEVLKHKQIQQVSFIRWSKQANKNKKNPKPIKAWDDFSTGGVAPYWTVSASAFIEDQDLSMFLKGKCLSDGVPTTSVLRWWTTHLLYFSAPFPPSSGNPRNPFRRLNRS